MCEAIGATTPIESEEPNPQPTPVPGLALQAVELRRCVKLAVRSEKWGGGGSSWVTSSK